MLQQVIMLDAGNMILDSDASIIRHHPGDDVVHFLSDNHSPNDTELVPLELIRSSRDTLPNAWEAYHPTKAEFNNCFIIRSKYLCFSITLFVFPLTKCNTALFPGFLGQRFNNLLRAALLTSF